MSADAGRLDAEIVRHAKAAAAEGVRVLREAIRLPADFVDRPADQGGDPACGTSNHEGPRLEFLKRSLVGMGSVDSAADAAYDRFGNLHWTVQDKDDGVRPADKTVVWYDGHVDTVKALRPRWHEAAGGVDPYLGLTDAARVNRAFLAGELGYLPPEAEWEHLVWGRGSADQLGGVVSQMMATAILRATRPLGSLHGVIVRGYATVAEEDNDGGGPMWVMREEMPGAPAERVPDAVILTDSTGCARQGALGIYRGQRGRMQIEVRVTGKSCHGSMPHEGRNPLEYGAAILVEAAQAHAKGTGMGDDAFLGRGTRTASFATLDTPSDCAVPERFTFRFDRRLTAGEDPRAALQQIEGMATVAAARAAGLSVDVRVPHYADRSWRGVPADNPQIYPGWLTPEEHPVVAAAVDAWRRVATPQIAPGGTGGALRAEPRVGRWVFSTDGVGYPTPAGKLAVPATKRWVTTGPFTHPAMLGIGTGIEQNTHKIGECLDAGELPVAAAVLARFPSALRQVGV